MTTKDCDNCGGIYYKNTLGQRVKYCPFCGEKVLPEDRYDD